MNTYGPHHYVTASGNLVLLDIEASSNNEKYFARAVNGQLDVSKGESNTGTFTLKVQSNFIELIFKNKKKKLKFRCVNEEAMYPIRH